MTKQMFLAMFLVMLVGCGDTSSTNQNENLNNNATQPVCGNGVVEIGELCDNGSQNSDTAPDACRTTCRTSYCGDGTIDEGERCDGSNLVGNTCQTHGFTAGALACTPDTCRFDTSGCSRCGDGVAEGTDPTQVHYEVCDGTDLRDNSCLSIGQAMGVLACQPLTCAWDISGCVGTGAVCGNGIIEDGELCDDGNDDVTDACPDGPEGTCVPARCGDGYVLAGVEECDDGNGINGDLCPDGTDGTCLFASCGDGHVWIGQEPCDTGSDPFCYTGCVGFCGDGVYDNNFGERCDTNTPGCYADCSGRCGDDIVDASHGEEYDWGDALWNDCVLPACGDGVCDSTAENGHMENSYNCAEDCGCVSGTFLGTLCPDGRCTQRDLPVLGAPNCGGCGITCGPSEQCRDYACEPMWGW